MKTTTQKPFPAMSTPFFRFKQFTVWHDKCAMKVGTDGVLLGAWATPAQDAAKVTRILDIGTGSGLVGLILAQRFPNALVEGIDVEADAVLQARDNFARSPFHERLRTCHARLQEWQSEPYDLIVSNPPYFMNSLVCPNGARTNARHDTLLPFADLIIHSNRLLADMGTMAFILPVEAEQEVMVQARLQHFFCHRRMYVHTKEGKPAKRVLLSFARTEPPTPLHSDALCLSDESHPRTPAYSALTKDFYL